MIFVTVGTIGFDALVQRMDEARREIADEIVIQIGSTGTYIPKHCAYFRSAPTLTDFYDRASLVVGHGGTGTTLGVLERGSRLVSVRNPEMIDDHQDEFLTELEGMGLVSYCRNLKDLPQFIAAALAKDAPPPYDPKRFFVGVISALENF